MYYKTLLTCLIVAVFTNVKAQETTHSCGFEHWIKHLKTEQPDAARAMHDQYEAWIEQSRQQFRDDEVYQIPVVFHIVHNTNEQNLADSVVHSQLEVLNEDYRRMNLNASETREEFLPVAADVGIEFVLADTDPQGNPTTGIVRTATDRDGFEMDLFATDNTLDDVKFAETGGSDAWNTENYLNIWVCNISAGFLGQIFGLAYPPATTPNWPEGASAPDENKEGVIIHYTTLGRNNPAHEADDVAENNLGRTLVHEVGHYFGLRHIWGDAIPFLGEDGCEADDGFTDTPNCAEADNFQCDYSANTCTDSPTDFPNMIENYMDYSHDACMNMFTQEQADMMRFVLTELRPGLLDSTSVGVSTGELLDNQLAMFPNPAKGHVNISSPVGIDQLEVFDYAGRNLKTVRTSNQTQLEIPLNDLAPGSYVIRIHSGDEVAVRKLIRQ